MPGAHNGLLSLGSRQDEHSSSMCSSFNRACATEQTEQFADHYIELMFFERDTTLASPMLRISSATRGEAPWSIQAVTSRMTCAWRASTSRSIKRVIETHRQEDFVMGSAEFASVTNGRHKAFGHGDIRPHDGEALRRAVRNQEAHE